MAASQATGSSPPPDTPAPQPPADDVSCLAWAPGRDLLAAGAWDGSTQIWEVEAQGPAALQITPRLAFNSEAPVLGCCFSGDGRQLFSAGCDNQVTAKDLETQRVLHRWRHDAPVRSVFAVEELGIVVSASWDRTVRLWSAQQPSAVATLQLPERAYAMDVKFPLMVVGCADRHLLAYNLQSIQQNPNPMKTCPSSLKMQTRSVSCFSDRKGYAVGSIEGRCSIVHLEEAEVKKNFTFKCHRSSEEHFAVNSIDFHPTQGTFATAGSDGTFVFWDKDMRTRLKQFSPSQCSISAGKFSSRGDLYAYAVSYDWSRGHNVELAAMPRQIMVHKVIESEVKAKAPKK